MTEQIATGTVVLGEGWDSHRITGYVTHARNRGIDPNLDVALISHVEGGLWQGGAYEGLGRLDLPEGFDYVLSLYPWGTPYALPSGCDRDTVKMYDALDQDAGFDELVDQLSERVARRLKEGKTCLVHCQAGLNRSGLIAAAALVKMGHTGQEAIDLLRKSRSHLVLCNETFENYVLGLTA